jgi:hypothetical protein
VFVRRMALRVDYSCPQNRVSGNVPDKKKGGMSPLPLKERAAVELLEGLT